MVKLKRISEAQMDLFSWQPKEVDKKDSPIVSDIPTDNDPDQPKEKKKRVKAHRQGKTYVRRELPIQPYEIIDTFYSDGSGDNYWYCENCGRIIANIATVKGLDNNETYLVGMDCAATLSSISQDDIEKWSDGFKLASSIRNKISSLRRSLGKDRATIALHTWDCNNIIISGADIQRDGFLAQYFPNSYNNKKSFSIKSYFKSMKDFLKYCPDIAKQIMLNSNFTTSDYSFDFLGKEKTTTNFLEKEVTYNKEGYTFKLLSVPHHYYDNALECSLKMYKGSVLYSSKLVRFQSSNAVNTWEGGDITYSPEAIYEAMSEQLNNANWASNLESLWDFLDGNNVVKNIIPKK